jgi:hypothetical protein
MTPLVPFDEKEQMLRTRLLTVRDRRIAAEPRRFRRWLLILTRRWV